KLALYGNSKRHNLINDGVPIAGGYPILNPYALFFDHALRERVHQIVNAFRNRNAESWRK
ncbi:hypothetical protein QO226_22385, partial [Vibrio vulnificus]|uniref:hypothetical protein n=1 Tax=Vibrio vulnificus TaxID=672 RepID=UPI0024E03F6D